MTDNRQPYKGCNTTYKVVGTQQHSSGYTQYKIIITVVKLSQSQDFLEEKVILKRYNEVRSLHKTLFNIHKSLYLPGTFPPFVKPNIFGRFDETVIKERAKCIQDLFDFVCEHKPLHNSKAVQEFFKPSECLNTRQDLSNLQAQPIKPVECTPQQGITHIASQSSTNDNSFMEFDPINDKEDVSVEAVRNDWLAVLNNAVLERPINHQVNEQPTQDYSQLVEDVTNLEVTSERVADPVVSYTNNPTTTNQRTDLR